MDAQQLTAPVRAKDHRIAELEDLVRDLVAGGPIECDDTGRPYCCRWCRFELPERFRSLTKQEAAQFQPHDFVCPYPRAERALPRT